MTIKIVASCVLDPSEYMRGFNASIDADELINGLKKNDGEHAFEFLADAAGRNHADSKFNVSVTIEE